MLKAWPHYPNTPNTWCVGCVWGWLEGKNPEVKAWIEKMQVAGKGGKPLVAWKRNVSTLYVVCRTLEISPNAFLINIDETKRLMTELKNDLMKTQRTEYIKENII